MPSENTGKIVVDPTGRITAISDDLRAKPRPLAVGDMICFEEFVEDVTIKSDALNHMWASLRKRPPVADLQPITPKLMKHAVDTFGSASAAREWLSIECGALNNESPASFIHRTDNVAEVERILNCIDYGMIA